jgi:intraflagellar transport protein 172
VEIFGKTLEIAYFLDQREYCLTKKELANVAAKIAISLLRYTKVIAADKAFLDAGQAAKVKF